MGSQALAELINRPFTGEIMHVWLTCSITIAQQGLGQEEGWMQMPQAMSFAIARNLANYHRTSYQSKMCLLWNSSDLGRHLIASLKSCLHDACY